MNYLIIEDEPLAAEELARMLKKIEPDCTIVSTLNSVEEAIQWIPSNPDPDIIFMDIHLSDNICFEIFNEVEVSAPVIFTTAYDKYALNAFNVGGVGYLLKPIEESDLTTAINRIKHLKEQQEHEVVPIKDILNSYNPNEQIQEYKQRIITKIGDNYGTLDIDQVAYFYSEDHYTFVCSHDNIRSIINYTLDKLDQQLDPKQFFRISRNCIVNIKAIKNICRNSSRMKVELTPPHNDDFFVARNRVQNLLLWLDDNKG